MGNCAEYLGGNSIKRGLFGWWTGATLNTQSPHHQTIKQPRTHPHQQTKDRQEKGTQSIGHTHHHT